MPRLPSHPRHLGEIRVVAEQQPDHGLRLRIHCSLESAPEEASPFVDELFLFGVLKKYLVNMEVLRPCSPPRVEGCLNDRPVVGFIRLL